MRVGIDISAIHYGTGVARYTANLVRALTSLEIHDFSLTLFGSSLRKNRELLAFAESIERKNTDRRLWHLPPRLLSWLVQKSIVTAEMMTGTSDLFHAWDWYLPQSSKVKTVMTVHDLALFRYPDTAHESIRKHHLSVIERGIAQRTHVIAVSEATKADLLELFSYPEQLIRVIPEALPLEQCIEISSDVAARMAKTLVGDKPYLLIVGTHEPRKNIPRMIAAWEASFKNDFDLVVVGKSGWENIDPRDGMHLVGYLAPKELAALYSRAEALLYCSLYEGFGLPILEAFYHHTPVVTSNVSSMPEIAGKAAVLVNPHDTESIRDGIMQAVSNPSQWRKRGAQRLKQYTDWELVARETYDFYTEIVERL